MIYYGNENSSFIKHYGVIGMRWGHHRYNSMIKKSNKLRTKNKISKSNKLKSKAELYKQGQIAKAGGKKAYEYGIKEDPSKSVLKVWALGTYGSLKYNQFRSKGNGRVKSYVLGYINEAGNVLSGGLLSAIGPRSSSEYNKYKAAKKAYRSKNK